MSDEKKIKLLSALTIVPRCALEISLKTQIPYKEVMRCCDKLARQGVIIKPSSSKLETTYRIINPYNNQRHVNRAKSA